MRQRQVGRVGMAISAGLIAVLAVAVPAGASEGAQAGRPSVGARAIVRNTAASRSGISVTRRRAGNGSPIAGALIDHGGPVQNNPKLDIVFWNWKSDPDGEKAYLINFLSSIGDSPWLRTLSQYKVGVNPTLGGTWTDRSNVPPAEPTTAEIYNEAVAAAVHFGLTSSARAQIIVAMPTGVGMANSDQPNSCAYHEPLAAPGTTYTVLPYLPDADFGAECGAGSVNSGSALDAVSIVAGHEIAESMTDPLLNAWYDAAGNEVADKCAWYHLADTVTSLGTFAVQPLWSNKSNGCVLAGKPPEEFRITSITPSSVSNVGGKTLTIKGTGFINTVQVFSAQVIGGADVSVNVTVDSDTKATVIAPAAPGFTGLAEVELWGCVRGGTICGSEESEGTFTYVS